MLRALVLAAATAALGSAQRCFSDKDCSFTATVSGTAYSYDFAPLCLPATSGDYFFSDGQGHNYYANVCGNANQICLPQSWLATYETGVSVQMWGSTPPCDRRNPATLKCLEKSTQLPTCCTANCQVLGVMNDAYPPKFSLVVPTDPNGGVKATFIGAPPDDDDPFWCPFDPATGLQYNRTVSMIFACDESITGDAVPLLAVQNSSESCDYTLLFATAFACSDFTPSITPSTSLSNSPTDSPSPSASFSPSPSPAMIPVSDAPRSLSGGWVFIIVGISLVSVYVLGGMVVSYVKDKVWEPPHRRFWSAAFSYVDDGVDYIINCDRRRGGGTGSLVAPSAPAVSTTSPYAQFGAATAAPAGSAYSSVGGYNVSGSAAYSDL